MFIDKTKNISEDNIQKCSEWLQNVLEHFTVKSTPYTLNKYPPRPNLCPFCSNASHFQDKSLLKIGNAPNDIRMTMKFNSQE